MNVNLRIDRRTPVIVQGITGRAGQLHSRLMMQYGTRIVGGVSPGGGCEKRRSGFSNCAEAVAKAGAQASVLLVGALQLLAAMRTRWPRASGISSRPPRACPCTMH